MKPKLDSKACGTVDGVSDALNELIVLWNQAAEENVEKAQQCIRSGHNELARWHGGKADALSRCANMLERVLRNETQT